ncbi:MAG: site-specific DNA-methyltransferase [Bacillota bacterium]
MADPATAAGFRVVCGDALEILRDLEPDRFLCCITSPPYYGLRDYGAEGQIGLEPTPEEYVSRLVAVFREVRRVLHPAGTLWLVLGDTWWGSWGNFGARTGRQRPRASEHWDRPAYEGPGGFRGRPPTAGRHAVLKPKDLVGAPWRVAFALQEDGWWLRSCVVWEKPNVLPEGVKDRPVESHEYVFLLAKGERYYYDCEAMREPRRPGCPAGGGRLRSVWSVFTTGFSAREYGIEDADHYAVFPEELAARCIVLSTPEAGVCPECGRPWRRVVEEGPPDRGWQRACGGDSEGCYFGASRKACPAVGVQSAGDAKTSILRSLRRRVTVGWEPSCGCGSDPIPAEVLDPFCGSGTTLAVAVRLGRRAVGIDINPAYCRIAEARAGREARQLRLPLVT